MKILSATTLVLVSLVLAACGGSSSSNNESGSSPATGSQDQTAKQDQQKPTSGSDDAAGKEVFTANCASCHTLAAADATGTVGPNLDNVKWSEAQVKKQVENGGATMPPFSGTLSSDEIGSVAKFVSDNDGS